MPAATSRAGRDRSPKPARHDPIEPDAFQNRSGSLGLPLPLCGERDALGIDGPPVRFEVGDLRVAHEVDPPAHQR
jgi:hypothetical protein